MVARRRTVSDNNGASEVAWLERPGRTVLPGDVHPAADGVVIFLYGVTEPHTIVGPASLPNVLRRRRWLRQLCRFILFREAESASNPMALDFLLLHCSFYQCIGPVSSVYVCISAISKEAVPSPT